MEQLGRGAAAGPVLADLAASLGSPLALALLVAAYVGAGYSAFLAPDLWPRSDTD